MACALTPPFRSGTTSYAASVGYTVTRTTVAAAASHEGATIEYLDGNGGLLGSGGPIDVELPVGETVIAVRVTAQDGVEGETYTVTVTRAAEDLSLTPPASDPVAPFASRATYTLTFRGAWTSSVTPGGRPGGVYFSRLIGGVHSDAVTFLESGATASSGVESDGGGRRDLDPPEGGHRGEEREPAHRPLRHPEDATGSISPTAVRTLRDRPTDDRFPARHPDDDDRAEPRLVRRGLGTGAARRLGPLDAIARGGPLPLGRGNRGGRRLLAQSQMSTPPPRGVITSIRGTGRFTTERIASLGFTLQSVRTERRVPENAPGGVNIGARGLGGERARVEVTYTLGGPDAASFELVRFDGSAADEAGRDLRPRGETDPHRDRHGDGRGRAHRHHRGDPRRRRAARNPGSPA